MPDTSTIAGIISGVTALAAALLAYRSSKAANDLSSRKVDQEAFDRSQAMYERLLDRMQAQLDRVNDDLDTATKELAEKRASELAMLAQMGALKRRVGELEQTLASIRAVAPNRPKRERGQP